MNSNQSEQATTDAQRLEPSRDPRDAIALAIFEVENRWMAPNFPSGHRLPTFDEMNDKGRRLHFDYAEAVLALERPNAAAKS